MNRVLLGSVLLTIHFSITVKYDDVFCLLWSEADSKVLPATVRSSQTAYAARGPLPCGPQAVATISNWQLPLCLQNEGMQQQDSPAKLWGHAHASIL